LPPEKDHLWQTAIHFFTLVLILVFANWELRNDNNSGLWFNIWSNKCLLLAIRNYSNVFVNIYVEIKWQWSLQGFSLQDYQQFYHLIS
jgi:hypothetical protein